ncbi:hypothetical protein D9M70_501760 [compost metagenome]
MRSGIEEHRLGLGKYSRQRRQLSQVQRLGQAGCRAGCRLGITQHMQDVRIAHTDDGRHRRDAGLLHALYRLRGQRADVDPPPTL